jgi:hypothetical protein
MPGYGGGATPGQVLARVTLLPPVLVMAWLLPGLPLLLIGQFTIVPMLALWVPLAIALTVAVLVFAPVAWPHRRTPWWPVAAVFAIAVGFGVWQGAMVSQQVIVRRDPATYLQFAYWIARHGSLPIPQLRSAFGGPVPGLSFASLGFYQHGAAIVPQFMAGLPLTLAAAFWINGIQLAVYLAPVFGACAVLTFGGLVGRLCGPRWAPFGALMLALSLPEVYTSRSTFSEPLAQILLFGGFCLVTDALWLAPARRAVARGGAAPGKAASGTARAKAAAAGTTPAVGTALAAGTAAGTAPATGTVPVAGTAPAVGTGAGPAPAAGTAPAVGTALEAGTPAPPLAATPPLTATAPLPPTSPATATAPAGGAGAEGPAGAGGEAATAPIPGETTAGHGRPTSRKRLTWRGGLASRLGLAGTGGVDLTGGGAYAGGTACAGGGQQRLRTAAWLMAGLGGLAFGLSTLVRIDGISDVLPVILFCGVLYVTRRSTVAPLAAGLLLGVAYGLADGYLLSAPYLNSLSSLLRPLGYAAAGFVIATAVAVAIAQWRGLPQMRRGSWSWVPDITAMAVVLVVVAFAVRPVVQTVRGETSPVTVAFIAEVQKLAHLPIDPHRTYAEDSLYWVIWYIGLPAVLLAMFGAAQLARRFLRGTALIWGLPVMVIGWTVVTTLWKPGIVPDQPWASRRLVPVVLPGLVLFAVWTCGWLVRRARARGAGQIAQGAVAACCAVALLLPAAVTTFGLGLGRASSGGIRIVANGLGFKRTDTGEIVVVNQLCHAIGPGAAVVIVDPLTADRFTQIVRGMCGVPAARMDSPTQAGVMQVVTGIQRAGRRPVLLAADAGQLAPYGGSSPSRVLFRATRQDEHRLTQPPTTTWRILYQVWMSAPGQQPGA